MGGEEAGPIRTAVLAAPFRVAPGRARAYVPVLIEVDGPSLIAGTPAGDAAGRDLRLRLRRRGRMRDYFSQTLGLDLAKVGPALQQSGLKFFGHLDLPPGEYSLRVLVRNGATGPDGLQVVPLEVPDVHEAGAGAAAAVLPRAAGQWLIVREAPRAREKDGALSVHGRRGAVHPGLAAGARPGPGGAVSLVGYNLGAGEVRVAPGCWPRTAGRSARRARSSCWSTRPGRPTACWRPSGRRSWSPASTSAGHPHRRQGRLGDQLHAASWSRTAIRTDRSVRRWKPWKKLDDSGGSASCCPPGGLVWWPRVPPPGRPELLRGTDVVVVEVPVQVLRDGEPVRGLTADDFEVYEGRKKLPVTGFEVLDLEPTPPRGARSGGRAAAGRGPAPLPAPLRPLLLRAQGGHPGAQGRASDLVSGLHPSDLVARGDLHHSKGAAAVLGFTADRRRSRPPSTARPAGADRPLPDPLRLVLVDAGRHEAGDPTTAPARPGRGQTARPKPVPPSSRPWRTQSAAKSERPTPGQKPGRPP